MPYSGNILGTTFYTHHEDGRVWLGLVIVPYGMVAEEFDEADWIQWLQEELDRCHHTEVPKVFREALDAG